MAADACPRCGHVERQPAPMFVYRGPSRVEAESCIHCGAILLPRLVEPHQVIADWDGQ